MKRYPLLLTPVSRTAIWGGTRLLRGWNKTSEEATLAESWELSVREHETCTVQNGEAAGLTLGEALSRMGRDAISSGFAPGDRFPLLVKLIDAADALSVQVHPDDVYAREHEGECGKTEMWYVVEAEEGAHILYGLRDGVTASDFANAVREGRVEEVLRVQPVCAGESYFIPAGQPHAIGAGILVAEIQQNSDLTYRIFDYHRLGADGRPRALHREQAMAVVRARTHEECEALRYECGRGEDCLARCRYFSVERWSIDGTREARTAADRFSHLLCLAGEGTICFAGERYPITRGSSVLLPAAMGDYTLEGRMTLLCARP